MIRMRSRDGGYTIVEALIFLAVSGGIAVSAILLIAGQQQRTSFNQSVREMELIIQDVMNDVSTGFYEVPDNLSCSASGTNRPTVGGSGALGENQDCILVGRVIQFRSDTQGSQYRLYTLVGRRGSTTAVSTGLSQLRPTIVPQAIATEATPHNFEIQNINLAGNCSGTHAIAFLYTSTPGYTDSILETGVSNIDVVPLCMAGTNVGIGPAATESTIQQAVEYLDTFTPPTNPPSINPPGGITVCMTDGGTQRGRIAIGGNGRQFTTASEIGASIC